MIENLLFSTVSIQSPTVGKDASGGITKTYTTYASNVGASIQPLTAQEKVTYDQKGIDVDTVIYLAGDWNVVGIEWRVLYGSRTFYVQGVRDQISIGLVTALEVTERK